VKVILPAILITESNQNQQHLACLVICGNSQQLPALLAGTTTESKIHQQSFAVNFNITSI